MFDCQFRAGVISIAVRTPEKLDIKEPYSLFLCNEKQCDVTVCFEYISNIEKTTGEPVMHTDSVDVFADNDNYYFYYHINGESFYYALRVVNKNDMTHHSIFIPEQFTGQIWTRLVFSLINFDDLAAQFNASVFHASFIEYEGQAILFTAPCGTGKSTQASLWEKFMGAEIINGDKVLIYKRDGCFYAAGLPFSGSSNICKNKILPVKAVVRLSQAKENTVKRLKGLNAYKAVFEGCYHSRWSSDFNKTTSSVASDFATGVPVYHLACLPDENATTVLRDILL